jgi:hypothetical protein
MAFLSLDPDRANYVIGGGKYIDIGDEVSVLSKSDSCILSKLTLFLTK